MIDIEIKFKNNQIEKICSNEKEMKSFFKYDKTLIDGLKVLMTLLDEQESIYDFNRLQYLAGYNLEKVTNSDKYSIRIVPKKRKRKERMLLLTASDDGSSIIIVEINSHDYKKITKR